MGHNELLHKQPMADDFREVESPHHNKNFLSLDPAVWVITLNRMYFTKDGGMDAC